MDNSGLGSGFLSGSSGGFLGLESPIHRHQQNQLSPQSNTHHNQLQSSMNMMTSLENDSPTGLIEAKGRFLKSFSISFGEGKEAAASVDAVNNHNSNTSEDDEPSFTEDGNGENFSGGKGKKGSPWQRMKWTDNVVRLLIQVVACVGDDGTLEGVEGLKRKSGILQKKGKWKTVSKIMISKGCHVSPQQCEDKFNDLNKRYKKLNEILGRGTSCRVVENPALMDSMPQLSDKMKEDIKKILSSKHLFYKEICAYHNGQRIPNCSDFENAYHDEQRIPHCSGFDIQAHSLPLAQCSKDNNGSEDEEAEENNESEDDESDNENENNAKGDGERMGNHGERKRANEEEGSCWPQAGGYDRILTGMDEFFKDPTKSQWERQEWIKKKMLQLEEQRIAIQVEAFDLEQQRFKWKRFCCKKDRELEISRLENERMILGNERMTLQLKQKELEIDFKKSETSLDPTSLSIDGLGGHW